MVDAANEQIVHTADKISAGDGLIDATQNVIMNAAENVSEALGAVGKTAISEVPEIPFYEEVEFWVGAAFVLSVCVLFKPLGKFILRAMQKRVDKVVSDIDEAAILRDDAQNLLADYQRRFINAEKEAAQITNAALNGIQNLKNKELATLKENLANKERETNRRISAANTEAANEMYAVAGKNSAELASKAINHYLQTADKSRLIDEAIAELDKFIKTE